LISADDDAIVESETQGIAAGFCMVAISSQQSRVNGRRR
jgi:hypothetical protein